MRLDPIVTKTLLDDVLFGQMTQPAKPGEVRAEDTRFFKQFSTDKAVVTTAIDKGPGYFAEHAVEQTLDEATIETDNQKSHTVLKYAKAYKIPVEDFEDDQHDVVQMNVAKIGRNARATRDRNAMRKTYADGFSAQTSDSVALISNSHTAINGDTVDNLETGALTADSLETLVKALRIQPSQDGTRIGHNPDGLLVPPALFAEAIEITDSELKAGTGNNDINFFSHIYPGMTVGTSTFLDSADNSLNSNADTSYFVVSTMHDIRRYERLALETGFDVDRDDKDRMVYRARYREIVTPVNWEGVVGSNGTV